jgi:hypothetical protein
VNDYDDEVEQDRRRARAALRIDEYGRDERHLTRSEQEAIAAELRRLGYVVTAPKTDPTWLQERDDGDGFEMIGGGRDDG